VRLASPLAGADGGRRRQLGHRLTGSRHGRTASNSQVKVIALVDIIVVDPNSGSDFHGNGNAKQVTADIIWYGPNAVCTDGSPLGVLNGIFGMPSVSVKLVAG
jgi:hypothetical protein